jgi:hypothetical protein
MKISNYAPYAEERFETARQHPILHPERIIGNSELSRNGFEEVGRISTGKSASRQENQALTRSAFYGTHVSSGRSGSIGVEKSLELYKRTQS